MITLKGKENGIVIESTMRISKEKSNAIKKHSKEVKNFCKDCGVSYACVPEKDGMITSKLGMFVENDTCNNITNAMDLLQANHEELLKLANDWIDYGSKHPNDAEKDVTEIHKAIKTVREIAKKYNALMGVILMNDDGKVSYFGSIPPNIMSRITEDWANEPE